MNYEEVLQTFFLFLVFTALCVACSEDDQIGQNGSVPLEIASVSFASGDSVGTSEDSTRTRVSETADGFTTKWNDGDEIAVQIGDGTPGRYTLSVDADGHVTAINPTSESTKAYWPKGSGRQTITAWYPADANTTALDLTKQGDSGISYLAKSTLNATPGTPIDLVFSHELTKVWVSVAGFTNRVKSVQIYGYTSVTYKNGKADAGKPGWIPMRLRTYGDYRVYEASVAPGTFNSNNLIKVNETVLKVPVEVTKKDENNRNSTYISVEGVDQTFEPGYIYHYDVAYLDNIYNEEKHRCDVYTAEDLLAWNAGVKRDPTLGCMLWDDINMYNKSWPAICTDRLTAYRGFFMGNGMYIIGLDVKAYRSESRLYAGMFGCIAPGGKVCGLMLYDHCVRMGSSEEKITYMGGVAGYNSGEIHGCSMVGSIEAKNADYAGGIAGYIGGKNAVIGACWTNMFGGLVDDGSRCHGSIVGVASTGSVLHCYSNWGGGPVGSSSSEANLIVGSPSDWEVAMYEMNGHLDQVPEMAATYRWWMRNDKYQILTLKKQVGPSYE